MLKMFPNATVSSRSSSSHSGNSRNSSLPSLRMRNPLTPKTTINPLYRHSDAFTSFDASHFMLNDSKNYHKDKKAVLRRYHSHESHTNFSEIPKDSTPDSTKSRSLTQSTPETSPESTGDRKRHHEYEAKDFLERFSLPRVVRVDGGEPLLLYRCFDSFAKVQAKPVITRKGKEKTDANLLHFPEGYPGWFSFTNDRGDKSAITHTSILQLVREQVCSFISVQPFSAYAAHNNPDTTENRVQYLKTQVRGGQVFQLRAVFQHTDRPHGGRHSTKSTHLSRSARDKDLANRYAQLIGQNNQELYVPLTTKGEFYEIYSSIKARLCFPGMLDKTGPLALDRDCLYKLSHLLRRAALPLKVKLLAGPLPTGLPKDFTDTFILERKFQEPLLVTCTLPSANETVRHDIGCINLNSDVRLSRSLLSFDSESKLFKSQRLQTALAFCHRNVENWYREVRLAPNFKSETRSKKILEDVCSECKKINKTCGQNCSQENAEENTDEYSQTKQLITKEALEKFPKPRKWYKHFKILGMNSESACQDPDGLEKVKSIERYKDMSKLIEEKFGKKSYNPVKKSASFMFSTKRIDLEEVPQSSTAPALLKCQSLDTQIYPPDASKMSKMSKTKKNPLKRLTRNDSHISDSLNSEFHLCILDNENSVTEPEAKTSLLKAHGQSLKDLRSVNLQMTQIDWDEIKPVPESSHLKKIKPDLIPTLGKEDRRDNSYITERLCSEFHVKTKVQKKSLIKQNLLASSDNLRNSKRIQMKFSAFEFQSHHEQAKKSVVVQVHEEFATKNKTENKLSTVVDDLPYSQVADEVGQRGDGKKAVDEDIYAEICESACGCPNNKLCECKRTKTTDNEYCYVKLGSNGDSVTQSDSDEAIYNTLR